MAALPTGTVTFLFTDIEGSTTLLQRLGDHRYAEVLAEYQRLLRDVFAEGHGQEIDTQGDAFLVAFPRARDAVATAVAAQQALIKHSWPDGASLRVRIGLHTGEPLGGEMGYVGLDVHRAARIAAAGYGGQILVSDATYGLVSKDLPDGMSLRELGEYRLKDLAQPHRLFQVVAADLPADFPPIRSLDVLPNNLPRQLTSFIGREKEIAEVKRRLSTAYLVTLTGSGGAGKTRLALQVAADVSDDYQDGVWFAEFAPIADPALIPKAVAMALNVPEQPGREMTESLVDALRPKALLLLFDNCEHLLAACRDLAAALLQTCPHVRILATSREGLGIPGETLWRVPSLSVPEDFHRLPPPGELVLFDAVRLFVDRAVATAPEFTVTDENAPAVAQVCRRLDGIPLGIELAAARIKVLAVEQIAARLDDRFRLLTGGSQLVLPRHQTLRGAIDWSYNLLSEPERVLLRRLSVFAGGWTLEGAEATCSGDSVEASDILDLLSQLVDKSLVVAETLDGEARYRLLETVRQYSLDKLQKSGEADDVRRRHRDWYLALAEQADPEISKGRHTKVWLKRLEVEHDNLRAALEWSETDKDSAEAGLRLAGALSWFWFLHDHWSEGLRWTEAALLRSADVRSSALPRALAGATHFAWRRGDHKLATTLGEKGLALSRELGDKDVSSVLLFHLGIARTIEASYEQAAALFDECLKVSQEMGNRWLYGMTLVQLGIMAWFRGDDEGAATFHSQSLAVVREVGDTWTLAYALHRFGRDVALQQGDYGRAAACFRESLILCQEAGNRWISEECLEGFGRVASATRRYERAARLLGAAEVQREALGYPFSSHEQPFYDECVAATRVALGDTTFAAAWAEGRAMTLEQAIEYALAGETA